MLRVKFQIRPAGSLAALTAAFDGATRIELDNAIFIADDKWMEHVTIIGVASSVSITESLSVLDNCRLLDSDSITRQTRTCHLLLLVEENDPFIVTTITGTHAVPHRLFLTNNRLTAVVFVQDWDHLKEFAEHVESRYDAFELRGTSQAEVTGIPLGSQQFRQVVGGTLTNRQLTILETAHQMGYFDVPQQANGEEVANELDISEGGLSEQLRNSQNTLFDLLFGADE